MEVSVMPTDMMVLEVFINVKTNQTVYVKYAQPTVCN